MIRRPPRSTRTDTLCPYTTLFRSSDLVEGHVERRCELLVHLRGVVAGHEVRLPPVPPEHGAELVVADAVEDRRVGDLVAVQVQDREHRAVADGVEELVRVPGGGQRTGLRLAVTRSEEPTPELQSPIRNS